MRDSLSPQKAPTLAVRVAHNGGHHMPNTLNAAEMRRLAMQCAARASQFGVSADERDRMLRMREGLLEVAASADWLAGRWVAAAA
jgi:hypothetical protein